MAGTLLLLYQQRVGNDEVPAWPPRCLDRPYRDIRRAAVRRRGSSLASAGFGPLKRPSSEFGAVRPAVFGTDRDPVLAELLTLADRFAECREPVSGYAGAWNSGDTPMVGQLVAADIATATTLTGSLAGGWRGPPPR